jgi:hypothetical protein
MPVTGSSVKLPAHSTQEREKLRQELLRRIMANEIRRQDSRRALAVK